MSSTLHQLQDPSQLTPCLARCQPGDGLLLIGPATALLNTEQPWPAQLERFGLQTDIEHLGVAPVDPSIELLTDEQWVGLVARFELTMCW